MDGRAEPSGASDDHPFPRAATWFATIGASVVACAAAASVVYLGFLVVVELARSGMLLRDLALAAAAAVAGIAVIGIVLRIAARAPARGLVVAVTVFAVWRAALVVAFDGSLTTDWLAHHRLAIGWTLGAPPVANRPMGYPILLGEAYRWAGAEPAVGEILGLSMALLGALLLAGWVRLVAGTTAAAAAVAILAVSPSQGLYTLLLGTEMTFGTTTTGVAFLATLTLRSVGERGPESGRCPWPPRQGCCWDSRSTSGRPASPSRRSSCSCPSLR